MPDSVAFGPHHILYVADAAAQRIRALSPDGSVTTIAGGGDANGSGLFVSGSFRNGDAKFARFYHPSGVAVRRDGGIYVADTFNHCIRLIWRGVVSTVAGRCGVRGSADGGPPVGRLAYPRGLALSVDGTLYIADQKNGVRILSPPGTLRTIRSPSNADFRNATGVSAVGSGDDTMLYVANVDRLVRYDLRSREAAIIQDIGAGIEINRVQGGGPLGRPYSICALSQASILYGDLHDGSLRYVENFLIAGIPLPHLQYAGGAPPENSTLGFAHADRRLFSAPMGIAIDSDGRIAVADAIQRKIVFLRLREHRHAYQTALGALKFGPRQYRIAIQGNSFAFFSAGFTDSIAGLLEERLATDRELREKTVKVSDLYSRCPDAELLATGAVDLAILIVNAYNIDCNGRGEFERDPALAQRAGPWQKTIASQYSTTVAALSRAHVKALLLLIPMAWELSPLEVLYRRENIGYYEFSPADYAFPSDYRSAEGNWLLALNSVPAPVVNTFGSFRNFESAPHDGTLFATDDLHLSKLGRSRVMDVIAQSLERQKPWLH